jgi:hypothetical protein
LLMVVMAFRFRSTLPLFDERSRRMDLARD